MIIKIGMSIVLVFIMLSSVSAEGKKYIETVPRQHTAGEIALDVGILYSIHWAGDLLMFKVLSDGGGDFQQYKENFFLRNIQWWDGDSIWWNFVGHPYTGSQTYLYYRARGYSKRESFLGSFVASFLFESTIEILHEPFSFNDAVITPAFGYLLGTWFEKISLEMINSESNFKKVLARIINLSLNFRFYEGIEIVPVVSGSMTGLFVACRF